MHLVRLRPQDSKVAKVIHPLLDDCKPHTVEDVEKIANSVMAARTHPDELIMSLFSCLRYTVGQYLHNWPVSRPHLDDIVSVGLMILTKFVYEDLCEETLNGRKVMHVITQRFTEAINTYLNDNQAITAPSIRTQKRRIRNNKKPIYRKAATNNYSKVVSEDPDSDMYKRDVMDALEAIEARDKIDAFILCSDNWGRTAVDIADELGVPSKRIQRKREFLYNEFLNLTR